MTWLTSPPAMKEPSATLKTVQIEGIWLFSGVESALPLQPDLKNSAVLPELPDSVQNNGSEAASLSLWDHAISSHGQPKR